MWLNNKINMIAFKWFEYMIIYLLNILSCLCNHRLSDDTHTRFYWWDTHTFIQCNTPEYRDKETSGT